MRKLFVYLCAGELSPKGPHTAGSYPLLDTTGRNCSVSGEILTFIRKPLDNHAKNPIYASNDCKGLILYNKALIPEKSYGKIANKTGHFVWLRRPIRLRVALVQTRETVSKLDRPKSIIPVKGGYVQ